MFMHESTQLNGTNIVPTPSPLFPDCWLAAAQRPGTSLSSTLSRTQQFKGLALVYFEKSTSHCLFVLTSTEVAAQHEM